MVLRENLDILSERLHFGEAHYLSPLVLDLKPVHIGVLLLHLQLVEHDI